MLPSAAELVARYLRANGYTETLKNFIQEADLPVNTGAVYSDYITIESILQEKKTFDTSLRFEKLGLDDDQARWTTPSPSRPREVSSLPNRSNILNVSVFDICLPDNPGPQQYIAVTTADRKLHLLDPASPTFHLVQSYTSFQDSPILDIAVIGSRYLLAASMSGKLTLLDTFRNEVLAERRDHAKYIVKLASWSYGNKYLLACASWDSKVTLYQLELGGGALQLGEPLAVLEVPTIPEALTFIESPENGMPILLLSRKDSTYLYYYEFTTMDSPVITLLGKQNLAPHSNAWVAFTPSDIQICPSDPSIVAIGTSSMPHMRLLIVRLLIPTRKSLVDIEAETTTNDTVTQASQARAELLIQNREEAAILVNVSTLAPQTQYSTPRLVWRPDGTGLYVSSEDGIIRGIEASSGKLISSLEGHDAASKLRCLWVGTVRTTESEGSTGSEQEFLVSGGFDQRMIVWSP